MWEMVKAFLYVMTANSVYSAHTILPGLVVFTLFTLSNFNSHKKPLRPISSTVDEPELRKAVAEGPTFTLGSVCRKLTFVIVAKRCLPLDR